jgi:hypothetical protein
VVGLFVVGLFVVGLFVVGLFVVGLFVISLFVVRPSLGCGARVCLSRPARGPAASQAK